MFSYYFNIGLIYFLIGFALALYFVFVLKKKMLGKFWGALLVSIVGAFLGGLIEFFFAEIIARLSNLMNAINIFPPIFASLFLLWIFSKANEKS